jgi:hypothetical protein
MLHVFCLPIAHVLLEYCTCSLCMYIFFCLPHFMCSVCLLYVVYFRTSCFLSAYRTVFVFLLRVFHLLVTYSTSCILCSFLSLCILSVYCTCSVCLLHILCLLSSCVLFAYFACSVCLSQVLCLPVAHALCLLNVLRVLTSCVLSAYCMFCLHTANILFAYCTSSLSAGCLCSVCILYVFLLAAQILSTCLFAPYVSCPSTCSFCVHHVCASAFCSNSVCFYFSLHIFPCLPQVFNIHLQLTFSSVLCLFVDDNLCSLCLPTGVNCSCSTCVSTSSTFYQPNKQVVCRQKSCLLRSLYITIAICLFVCICAVFFTL